MRNLGCETRVHLSIARADLRRTYNRLLTLGKNDLNLLRDADCNLILDENRVEIKIRKDEL